MRHTLLVIFVSVVSFLGCGIQKYRVLKAFNGRLQVLDQTFEAGPRLVEVQYKAGSGEPFVPYQLEDEPKTNYQRPPQIDKKAVIDLRVAPGVDARGLRLRIFIKKDPHFNGDFIEVKTIVGEIPGELPNAVAFVDDLFGEKYQRLLLHPDDLIGPYQGVQLQAHDWLVFLIEEEGSGQDQKFVFEYVPTGYRVSTGAHLLFSTGVNLLDVGVAQIEKIEQSTPRRRSELASAEGQIDPGGLDLALALTLSVGYRGAAHNGPRRWFADNFTLVFDVGVGNVGEIESILAEGTALEDRVAILQNQLLVGVGVQVFGFVSLHFLNNVAANFPVREGVDVEAVLIPELGFDVATAARFSKRLYERLFNKTTRRSSPMGAAPVSTISRLVPCQGQTCSDAPDEGLRFDESYQTP